jgi:hypothetical protein
MNNTVNEGPSYFQHERSCLQPGGGDSDDDCICSRDHIRKENKRLGLPTPLPENSWRKAGSSISSRDPYGCVFQINHNSDSMDALRLMFPNGQADPENWVLFSTGGSHGTYATIEDVEQELAESGTTVNGLTYIIMHPRIVSMKYGCVHPETPDDIAFLKKLRESSIQAVSTIGQPERGVRNETTDRRSDTTAP